MSKLRTASICYTDLAEAAKSGHTAFSRAKNGTVYFNVAIWDNDEVNKFGQDVSIALSPKKDTASERIYIGNGNKKENATSEKNTAETFLKSISTKDDLPF